MDSMLLKESLVVMHIWLVRWNYGYYLFWFSCPEHSVSSKCSTKHSWTTRNNLQMQIFMSFQFITV